MSQMVETVEVLLTIVAGARGINNDNLDYWHAMSPDLQLFALQQAAEIAKGLFLLSAATAALAASVLTGVLLYAWRTRR